MTIIKIKIIIIFSILICNIVYPIVAINKHYLQVMFYKPIPMNINSEKEVIFRLKSIGLSKSKISIITKYLKQNKTISFKKLYQKGIINYNESKILKNFFFDPNKNKDYIFESKNENEEYNDNTTSEQNINLNKLKKETILNLSFISKKQVNSIIKYKKSIKRYTSVYELLLIPNINRKTFIKLMPYLKNLKLNKKKLKNFIETRYKKTNKANRTYYIYNRINIVNDNIELNISLSKNDWQEGTYPGSLISKKLSWMDIYSQYSMGLYIKTNLLSIIAIGDYSLRFGQHLLFGIPYTNYLDRIDYHPIKKRDSGIHKYTNPNRFGVLRGLAVTFSINQFELTPFVYFNDYKLKNTRFINNVVNTNVESLINTGYGIINDKRDSKRLLESGGGANLTYKVNNNLKVGLTYAFNHYSQKIGPKTNKNNNLFSGNKLHLSSVYFDWDIIDNFNLFSEIALSIHKDITNKNIIGLGAVIGAILNNNILKYSFLIRYLDSKFHSPHSSNVISKRNNEVGLFQGIEVKPYNKLLFRIYIDLFKYLDQKPFNVIFSLKTSYNPNGLLLVYLFTITDKPYYSKRRTRIKNQLNLEYHINKYVSFRFRYENIISKKRNEINNNYGNLFYTQIKVNILKTFIIITRITAYSADNISSAVYAVENRLPFWYNGINSYYNDGISYCLILKTKLRKVQAGIKLEIDHRKIKNKTNIAKRVFLQLIYKW